MGVVGVGYLGRIHAEKYARIPEAELVGLVDIDEGRCREVADCIGCQPFFTHRDLVDRVEAVSIAVPTVYHYQIARDFLRGGVDVLLEKPIASSVSEARELNALAHEREVIFQIGHLERFNGAWQAMDGVLQDPFFIEAYRVSPFTGRGIDVDVVLDLMIHDIDIVLSIVDSDVEKIEATGKTFYSEFVDVASARIWFQNGCVAQMSASRVAQEKMRRMTILQRDAHLAVDYLQQSLLITRKGPGGEISVSEVVQKNDPLELQLKSFLQSVRNRRTPVVSGEDGQRALEVCLLISGSVKNGVQRLG